jgi:hypothetical protein
MVSSITAIGKGMFDRMPNLKILFVLLVFPCSLRRDMTDVVGLSELPPNVFASLTKLVSLFVCLNACLHTLQFC